MKRRVELHLVPLQDLKRQNGSLHLTGRVKARIVAYKNLINGNGSSQPPFPALATKSSAGVSVGGKFAVNCGFVIYGFLVAAWPARQHAAQRRKIDRHLPWRLSATPVVALPPFSAANNLGQKQTRDLLAKTMVTLKPSREPGESQALLWRVARPGMSVPVDARTASDAPTGRRYAWLTSQIPYLTKTRPT